MKILKPPPPDLTRLAAENHGKFPGTRVIRAITGHSHKGLHTTKMPSWERILRQKMSRAQARLRISHLTKYVKSLQETEAG